LGEEVKKFADDPQHAFPGQGQMKPEQLEIARLKREVAKLKAERDILKKAAEREARGMVASYAASGVLKPLTAGWKTAKPR
jgi:transposase-like protein